MVKISIKDMFSKIDRLEAFQGISEDGAFEISIKEYVPYICTSIHGGTNFNETLEEKLNIDKFDRWQEEDPCTDEFIDGFPITIKALDSRYEYDLNRSTDDAIYHEAWGKLVWKEELTYEEKEEILKKHSDFYKLYKHLVSRLKTLYKDIYVFDMHSYNYQRSDSRKDLPLFNLGTHYIEDRYRGVIDEVLERLSMIEIDSIENSSRENDVFHGKGYLAAFTASELEDVCVFPIEVKKVYCNENTGEYYRETIDELSISLKKLIAEFIGKNTDNISYIAINNLERTNLEVDSDLVEDVIALINSSYFGANTGEYSDEELEKLLSNRTPSSIGERLNSSYTILVKDNNNIIACGSLVSKDGKIEAKMLNVNSGYRGKGIARNICDIREEYVRSLGYNKIYIESLKFKKTIALHESRGFVRIESPRELKYSIYMCKDIYRNLR